MKKQRESRPKNRKWSSPPLHGVVVFWSSCILLTLSFLWEHPASYSLFVFVIPVIYGTHEAMHNTLVPRTGVFSHHRALHNTTALLLGSTLQLMNYRLTRMGHLAHHRAGRMTKAYFPEIVCRRGNVFEIVKYYFYLIGFAAISWQILGIASLALPKKWLALYDNLSLNKAGSYLERLTVQFVVVGFILLVWFINHEKIIVYFLWLSFVWSVLQNVGHYGLTGIDPKTNWACGHTYILEPIPRIFTFGSLAHALHHASPATPGAYLHEMEVRAEIERRLKVRINIEYGTTNLIRGLFRQFHGPIVSSDLVTTWVSKYD